MAGVKWAAKGGQGVNPSPVGGCQPKRFAGFLGPVSDKNRELLVRCLLVVN